MAGDGACPPEDCGGPRGYLAGLDDASSWDALEDLHTMADILREVVLENRPELLMIQETRWRLEDAVERSKAREHARGQPFSRRLSTPGSARASTWCSCTSSGDLLGAAPGEEFGGEQGGIVAALLADAGHQRVGGRVGQLVEPALESGGRRLGVDAGWC